MATSYQYELTSRKIKIKNISTTWNKRTGKLIVDFLYRGHDTNRDDADMPKVVIAYAGTPRSTKYIWVEDYWKKGWIGFDAGAVLNNQDQTDIADDAVLFVSYDEEEDTESTGIAVEAQIDLDPIEYKLNLLGPTSFGDDSTPDVIFTLDKLFAPQLMQPIITVSGGGSVTDFVVTYEDGTTASITSGYISNHNDFKFNELNYTWNSSVAGYTNWKKVIQYKFTLPTLSSGDNSYAIDLRCVNTV